MTKAFGMDQDAGPTVAQLVGVDLTDSRVPCSKSVEIL